MKNPTGTKVGKTGFRISGNINHVRYDHRSRPTTIIIKCPSCNGKAIARDMICNGEYEFAGDMSPQWKNNPFSITCTECAFRASDLSYEQLSEPYYQFTGRGEILWAWNERHLDMILKFLKNQDIKGYKYEFYQTYIHGSWKKYRVSYINQITKALKNA